MLAGTARIGGVADNGTAERGRTKLEMGWNPSATQRCTAQVVGWRRTSPPHIHAAPD